jgi:hypothetical protein
MTPTYPNLKTLARSCIETNKSRDEAAQEFMATLLGAGITKTPDGRRLSLDYARTLLIRI